MPEGSALERTAAGRARNRRRRPRRAGGDRLPDLRRRRRRRSISTAWCAITSCAAARTSPTSDQPRAQERAQGAEPRHRQARPPARRRDRRANTARASPWPKCRPARRCCKRSWPKSTGPTEAEPPRAGATRSLTFSSNTPGVVDTDWYIEADQPKVRFVIDKEKAALHGISAETISADAARSPSAARRWICCTCRARRRT